MGVEYRSLDIDNIARIALMYIDGEQLARALVYPYSTSTDDIHYRHDDFNGLKIALLKAEKINPDLHLVALLWRLRPDNERIAHNIAAGSTYAYEGIDFPVAPPELRHVIRTGEPAVKRREDGAVSYYYAVRNSDDDITGALELVSGHRFFRSVGVIKDA